MVTVFFQDDNVRVRVPAGKTMREIAMKTGASMAFGCRVGDCLTCAARVISGMNLLSGRMEKELRGLEMIGGDLHGVRLMCQCRVRGEEGEIVISYGL